MVRERLVCVLLVAATALTFSVVVRFDFVRFDDTKYVTKNPHVKAGLSAAGLRWAFGSTVASNWHPLTWLSHMLDVQLYGMGPAGHHLTNLLLHMLNSVLLFLIFRAMTSTIWPSALVAALFALHPIHVESVAWVAERKDLLSTLLGLVSIAAYVRYARRGGWWRYLLCALWLALGLMAKPMLVTLPLVFMLLDAWPLERLRGEPARWRKLGIEKLPLLAVSVAASVVTYLVQQAGGAMAEIAQIPLKLRLANAVVSYMRYVGKMFWPHPLSMFYTHPNLPGGTPWSDLEVIGAALCLLGITVLVVLARRPYARVGWLWYLGTLVPVIGVIQVGGQAIADRYTYLPLIGLFIVVAWAGRDLAARFRQRGWLRPGLAIVAVVVLVACAAAARTQAWTWKDSLTLLSHSLAAAPRSPTLHNNLGNELASRGQVEAAVDHYEQVLEIVPDLIETRYNLGIMLVRANRFDEAIEHLRQVVNRGAAHVITPHNLATAHHHLGIALGHQGRRVDALAHFEQAASRRADWPEPMNAAAWILATHPDPAVRRPQKAVIYAERAEQLTHHVDPVILDTLAAAYAAAGHFDLAAATAQRALELTKGREADGLAQRIGLHLKRYRQGRPVLELQ